MRGRGDLRPEVQALEEARCHRGAGFDFHRHGACPGANHQVDFVATVVAPEGELRLDAAVVAGLCQFRDHEVLEYGAVHGVAGQFFGAVDLQQVAEQPGVEEIELRALGQALVEVLVVRLQAEDDEARLQHGEPAPRRLVADAAVVAEAGEVEQLADAASAEQNEQAERFEVADLGERANVALQVGLEVQRRPLERIQAAVVNRRVEPAHGVRRPGSRSGLRGRGGSHLLGVAQRPALQLGQGEGQQMGDVDAPGQALGDALQQQEVLRTGEHELAGRAAFVRRHLHIGEEVRHLLHFVQNHRARRSAPGIRAGLRRRRRARRAPRARRRRGSQTHRAAASSCPIAAAR